MTALLPRIEGGTGADRDLFGYSEAETNERAAVAAIQQAVNALDRLCHDPFLSVAKVHLGQAQKKLSEYRALQEQSK